MKFSVHLIISIYSGTLKATYSSILDGSQILMNEIEFLIRVLKIN